MNILLTVFTLLLMLAMATYSRLQLFVIDKEMQKEYRFFMREGDRKIYRDLQQEFYSESSELPSSQGEQEEAPEERATEREIVPKKSRLNSRLSLDSLLKKSEREKNPLKFKFTQELLKKLMFFLYSKQAFFQEMQQKHPDFLDQLLERLVLVADDREFTGKIRVKEDIAILDLGDPELQGVYYKMLHGSRSKTHARGEFLSEEGYLSLLDFVSYNAPQRTLSIYLAPSELLMTLYDNVDFVNKIIETREEFYREIRQKNGPSAEQLSAKFKEAFANHSLLGKDESLFLDFSVSKTDPRGYR